MDRVIVENPRPARSLVLVVVVIGVFFIVGVVIYHGLHEKTGQLKRDLMYLLSMVPMCALVGWRVKRVLSPKGRWTLGDDGLRFVSHSGKIDWTIRWQAISKMKNTSVSLVIHWKDADTCEARKAVLLLASPEAQEIVNAWHRSGQRQLQSKA